MKVIAYNITPTEKEHLVLANHKKHDITIIANALSDDTVKFAEGKEVVLVFTGDDVSASIIKKLKQLGIRYITTATQNTNHIDLNVAASLGIQVANIPFSINPEQKTSENINQNMLQVVQNLDKWAAGICVGKACCCMNNCTSTQKS